MPRLSAPTKIVFLISLILAVIALLGAIVFIPVISIYSFWDRDHRLYRASRPAAC